MDHGQKIFHNYAPRGVGGWGRSESDKREERARSGQRASEGVERHFKCVPGGHNGILMPSFSHSLTLSRSVLIGFLAGLVLLHFWWCGCVTLPFPFPECVLPLWHLFWIFEVFSVGLVTPQMATKSVLFLDHHHKPLGQNGNGPIFRGK